MGGASPGVGYGADPSTLVVAGSSAGGNLAATAALTPNDPRFQPGFEDAETAVTAGVVRHAYYGNYHRGDSGQASSPLRLHPGGCAAVLHRAR